MEGSGDPIVEARLGQQVAGDLFDGELVKRHVGVECADNPVTVGPDRSWWIVGVAGAIGIPGQIEPAPGEMFAVAGMVEQLIHESLDGSWRGVSNESVNCLWTERQPGQVEGEPPGEGRPISLGAGRELL